MQLAQKRRYSRIGGTHNCASSAINSDCHRPAVAGYPPPVSYGPPQPEYPPSGGGGYPQAGYAQQPPAGYPMPGSYPPPQAHPLPHMAPQAGPHHKPPPPGNFSGYDQEAAQAAANAGSFAEALVRKQFVRKVFSLVFLQLCITIGVASCFIFVDAVRVSGLAARLPARLSASLPDRLHSLQRAPRTLEGEALLYAIVLQEYVRPGGDGQWVFIVSWVLSLVRAACGGRGGMLAASLRCSAGGPTADRRAV